MIKPTSLRLAQSGPQPPVIETLVWGSHQPPGIKVDGVQVEWDDRHRQWYVDLGGGPPCASYAEWKPALCSQSFSPTRWPTASAPCAACRARIVDTGSAHHLISRGDLARLKVNTQMVDKAILLATANGTITADTRAQYFDNKLGITLDPLVLDDSPEVVSVGRLTGEGDHEFFWPNWRTGRPPILRNVVDDSKAVELHVKDFVPYIVDDAQEQVLKDMPPAACPLTCGPSEGVGAAGGSNDSTADGLTPESTSPVLPPPESPSEVQTHGMTVPPPPMPHAAPIVSRQDRLRAKAATTEHLCLHLDKNPYCDTCKRAKVVAMRACRKHEAQLDEKPEEFGDCITGDTCVFHDPLDHGLFGEVDALAAYDHATEFCGFIPLTSKSALEHEWALNEFVGTDSVMQFYSDCSPELKAAAKSLGWVHPRSTPYRPTDNSVIERLIRTGKEGTRSILLHAGCPHNWWPLATPYFYFMRNVLRDSDIPGAKCSYQRRHHEPFTGWIIPFAALVFFRPIPPVMVALPEMAPRGIPGIFVGYKLQPGCIFKGQYLVVDIRDFDGSKSGRVRVQQVKEIVLPETEWEFPLKAAYERSIRDINPLPLHDAQYVRDEENDDDEKQEPVVSTELEPVPDLTSDLPQKPHIYPTRAGSERPVTILGEHWAILSHRDRRRTIIREKCINGTLKEWSTTAVMKGRIMAAEGSPPWHAVKRRRIEDATTGELIEDEIVQLINSKKLLKSFVKPMLVTVTFWYHDVESPPGASASSSAVNGPSAACPLTCGPLEGVGAAEDADQSRTPSDRLGRTFIEFCCSQGSKASDERYADDGFCERLRLTIADDLRTDAGLQCALNMVNSCNKPILLWGSLPCIAGCPWHRINRRHKNGRRKIRKHMGDFRKLMKNFRIVAENVSNKGGKVAMEWPTGCELWKDPEVVDFIRSLKLAPVKFHGCMLGLTGRRHGPIKKPWTIYTNCLEIQSAFGTCQCQP